MPILKPSRVKGQRLSMPAMTIAHDTMHSLNTPLMLLGQLPVSCKPRSNPKTAMQTMRRSSVVRLSDASRYKTLLH